MVQEIPAHAPSVKLQGYFQKHFSEFYSFAIPIQKELQFYKKNNNNFKKVKILQMIFKKKNKTISNKVLGG